MTCAFCRQLNAQRPEPHSTRSAHARVATRLGHGQARSGAPPPIIQVLGKYQRVHEPGCLQMPRVRRSGPWLGVPRDALLIRSIGVAGYPRGRGLEPKEDGSDAYFLTSGGARARFSGSERCKDVQVSLCGEHGYIHSACRQQSDDAPEFYSTSTCTAAGWDRAQGTSLTH